MSISKKIKEVKDDLDLDFQLMASELDTSVKNMKFISRSISTDAIMIDKVEQLITDIEQNGVEVTSFNDNTVLYEYLGEAVVIHSVLGDKFIIFDSSIVSTIESKLVSFN